MSKFHIKQSNLVSAVASFAVLVLLTVWTAQRASPGEGVVVELPPGFTPLPGAASEHTHPVVGRGTYIASVTGSRGFGDYNVIMEVNVISHAD